MNAGDAFGGGSYFTTRASKADFYTEKLSPISSLRQMLVARVALGEVSEATAFDSFLRCPPLDADGLRCDSVLGVPRSRGGCVDHDEFVVYERKQAVVFSLDYLSLSRTS